MSPSKRPIPTHHLRNSRDEQPCRLRDSNSLIQQSSYGRTTLCTIRPLESVLSAFTFHRLNRVQSTSRYKVFSTCNNVDLDLVLETESRRKAENVSTDMGLSRILLTRFVASWCERNGKTGGLSEGGLAKRKGHIAINFAIFFYPCSTI